MSVTKKKMKLGQNPANDLISDFFSINQCGDEIQETNQLQLLKEEEVQLTTQGVTDVFKFLDPTVIQHIVNFIKDVDINEIKRLVSLGSKMFEIDDNGDVYVNLRIKVNNFKSNPSNSSQDA
jgi:hypothetical protein